jgi:hypothetical protein
MHGILGGRWKHRHASRTEAHGESCGYATGRYSGRASALPNLVRSAQDHPDPRAAAASRA